MAEFEISSESVAFKRYLTVYHRDVKLPSVKGEGHDVLSFDIVGHPRCSFQYSVVFPFHPSKHGQEPTITIIKEYCQGPNAMCYNLPTGGYDDQKHKGSLEACATQELSEEAHLMNGELLRLIPEGHLGLWEVKWCRNRFTPFLCLDPEAHPDPPARDVEERIEILRVRVKELREIMLSGDMMLPSLTTCYLAFDELGKRGLI
jgi:hypothetical protein